jgi:hypothetical protein
MSYTGQVINGVVVLDPAVRLPEGANVRVDVLPNGTSETTSLIKNLLEWAGKGQDLPEDLAQNHDHYLHGSPKR